VNLALLIPVKYHYRKYPDSIESNIREVPGHLDVISLGQVTNYILHTEYSTKRKLDSIVLQQFNTLRTANISGIPQLWFNRLWAREFAGFLEAIVGENCPPLVIEIHPPYKDYCPSIEQFCEIYGEFESYVSTVYPETEILIENRFGSFYRNGKFLISSYHDIEDLASRLNKAGVRLGIVLDLPQMISQIGGVSCLSIDRLNTIFATLQSCRDKIRSIHLWGKRRLSNGRLGVHIGNLNDYFEENKEMKMPFLESLYDLINDGLSRYFVPEVNSGDKDVASIVNDLLSVGFIFRQTQ
jgi:hypothetical protein